MSSLDPKTIPNLFVIGAMKAGTTTFSQHLSRHPSIFVSTPKEPGYFSQSWMTDTNEYFDLFTNQAARAAEYRVDCSTDYSKYPHIEGVPRKIASVCPEAKFIYLVRHPVDRAISHYWTEVRDHANRKGLMESLTSSDLYVNVSDYAVQCEQYLQVFDPDRFLIISFDDLTSDTPNTLERVWSFLGLPETDCSDIHAFRTEAELPRVVRSTRLINLRYRSQTYKNLKWLIPKWVRRYAAERLYYTRNKNAPSSLDPAEEAEAREYLTQQLQGRAENFAALSRETFKTNFADAWCSFQS